MDPKKKYIRDLLSRGNQILEEYYAFLVVFKNNISRSDFHFLIKSYLEMDKSFQNRIYHNSKALNQFNNEDHYGYDDLILRKCRLILENITHSLDIYKSELHDELCSLNKNNSLFGLRYNRYQTNGLTPLYVDIKT